MNPELEKALEEAKKRYDMTYAGLTGSRCATERDSDWDVLVCINDELADPLLEHEGNVSFLILDKNWLKYKTHEEKPTGLIPSILFKSIELSKPLFGEKPKTDEIKVCPIDFFNCGVKRERFKLIDKKERLVAQILYELLKQNRIDDYCFDNIKLAEKLSLSKIAVELKQQYTKEGVNNKEDLKQAPREQN